MVKRLLSQSTALKISKNDKKQQLSSLIKVLRPKVYITDSSSFKTLVQELTGNGTLVSSPPPPPPPPLPTTTIQPLLLQEDHVVPVDVIDVEHDQEDYLDYHEEYHISNADLELSFDSSELSMATNSFPMLDSSPELSISTPFVAHDSSSQLANYQMDFSVYRDVESWLLEFEPFPYYNGYGPPFHQQPEISVCDYDISGLV